MTIYIYILYYIYIYVLYIICIFVIYIYMTIATTIKRIKYRVTV